MKKKILLSNKHKENFLSVTLLRGKKSEKKIIANEIL